MGLGRITKRRGRSTGQAAQRRDTGAPRETLTLSSFEWSFDSNEGPVDGSGYAFLDENDEPFFALDAENHKVETIDGIVTQVAGVSFYRHLQESCFAPGEPLALIREASNKYDANAVGVWNIDRTKQLGHLPRPIAAELAPMLDRGQHRDAMSLWEWRKGGPRVGVRILIAPGIKRDF